MKLFLHIGTEKTGSTSIQNMLYDNRSVLNDLGYFLFDKIGAPNNRRLSAAFSEERIDDYCKSNGINSIRDREVHFKNVLINFEDEADLARSKYSKYIISSEHFHSRVTKAKDINILKEYLSNYFEEIYLVCFFREQYSMAKSLYSTAMKVGHTCSFNEFLNSVNIGNAYYNHLISSDKWISAFGSSFAKFEIYRQDISHYDVRKSFLSLIDANPELFLLRKESCNRSIGKTGCLLSRINNTINSRRFSECSVKRKKALKIIEDNFSCNIDDFSNDSAQKIYSEFDSYNCEFGKKYFDSNSNPFHKFVSDKKVDVAEQGGNISASKLSELLSCILD